MSDRDRLTAALDDYFTEFIQRRWRTNRRHWERPPGVAFVHAKKRHPQGVDEALVMSRIYGDGIRVRRYVLLWNEAEWRRCDRDAFQGYLEDGPQGLSRGESRTKRTICSCGWRIHRSGLRAQKFAEELIRRYSCTRRQRPYRCNENPRAFHLTTQRVGSNNPAQGDPSGRGDDR